MEVVTLCACGCGKEAPRAKHSDKRFGHVKGQPLRFIRGHWNGTPYGGPTVLCACGCGSKTRLRSGKPCRFVKGHHQVTHGQKRNGEATPEYAAYLEAKKRCNPNTKDENLRRQYSGRGIKFLFDTFGQFLADVGLRPSPKYSLDRKYNDGSYEPGNVRWATRKEQRANQRGICGVHGPFSCPHCTAGHK